MINFFKYIFKGKENLHKQDIPVKNSIELKNPTKENNPVALKNHFTETTKKSDDNIEEIHELSEEDIKYFIQDYIDNGVILHENKWIDDVLSPVNDENDPLFNDAATIIVKKQEASASILQHKLRLGYNRASRIIDQLEAAGIIGPFEGSKNRSVNIPDIESLENFINPKSKSENDLVQKKYYSKERLFSDNYYKFYSEQIFNGIKEKIALKKDLEDKEKLKQQLLERERKKKLKEEAKKELQQEGHLVKTNVSKREERLISQEVKDLVWNRDNGRCVECGSNEKLEFDHIIPFSKGGSNTYRNIQLLCEKCNREKSNKIG